MNEGLNPRQRARCGSSIDKVQYFASSSYALELAVFLLLRNGFWMANCQRIFPEFSIPIPVVLAYKHLGTHSRAFHRKPDSAT
jgi:hypothetical protein